MTLERSIPPLATLLVFLLLWEFYVRVSGGIATVLPTPFTVVYALVSHWEILMPHAAQTFLEASLGLVCAIVLAFAVATLLFFSPRLRAGIYPLLVLSQTIPIIVLAPLFLIWFGFGLFPKVAIVVLYCFFPMTIALIDSLRTLDARVVDVVKSMRASSFQVFLLVRIPAALPAFFSGLRVAVTYALTGAIVGEFVGAYRGLGIFMLTAANSHATTLVFAALTIMVFLTLVLLVLVSIAERICIPWKNL